MAFAAAAACLLGLWLQPARGQDRENCLYCHQFPGLSRFDTQSNSVRLFYIDPSHVRDGLHPHARLACTDCHPRDEVGVVPHRAVTPVDCTRQCHLARPDAPPRQFSHESVERLLNQSAHSLEALSKVELQGGPLLAPGQSACLYCHDEPVFSRDFRHANLGNLNVGRCDVCHRVGVPMDTGYFLRHVVARLQPTRPTLELAQACAVCHSDPKFRAEREGSDPVASFVRSFHGKAALLGDQDTAGCVDCHVRPNQSAHLMLGADHPDSAVFATRVADSCRSTDCHPGADKSIGATAVHLDLPLSRGTIDYLIAWAFIGLTVISFGPSALIVVLELLQLVIGRRARPSVPLHHVVDAVMQHPRGPVRLQRFTRLQRVQHWLLSLLFALLVITGFPLKFPEQGWAAATIDLFGGLGNARVVHHWVGLALLIGLAAHLMNILRGVLVRAAERSPDGKAHGLFKAIGTLPFVLSWSDFKRVNQLLAYLLGLRRERPTFGRFSATEKFEYFGVLWGTTLLGLTGLMLWGEQITSHFLGGRAFNIATIIHTYEAFLALIHVGILHIFNVILSPAVFPLSRATLTGETPAHKLAEEHGDFVLDAARDLGVSVPAGSEAAHG